MSALVKTAWGEVVVKAALAAATGLMPQELIDLGFILEDSVSVETEDGTVLQLRGTGGTLLDKLSQEDTLTLNLTLIGVNKENVDKFWDTEEDENGVLWVKSTVTTQKFAIGLATKVVGSETLLMPNTSVKASLSFAEDQGWTMVCAFTFMKAPNGRLFGFGKVADATVDPPTDPGDGGSGTEGASIDLSQSANAVISQVGSLGDVAALEKLLTLESGERKRPTVVSAIETRIDALSKDA